MLSNDKITVITRFNSRQVGYLDFQYRISALKKSSLLDVVVSNIPQAQQELQVEDNQFVCIPGGIGGPRAQWKYFYDVKKHCETNKKHRILLLHSSLAPLASLLKNCNTFLYWNEHPSHFFGSKAKGRGRGRGRGLIARLKESFMLRLFYRGARDANVVMPIGEQHMLDLINAGCERKRLHMIYMGVQETFRPVAPKKSNNGNLRFIYTGSVKMDRGRDIMLDAIAFLKGQGTYVELDIVGATGDELAICNKRCSELTISDRVQIIGRVPGAEIPSYIQKADIGICIWADKPYWRFNPPTKLFEYLVAGLPVLANNMATHIEYLEDGINSLICEYDAESMAEAMARCVNDSSALEKMREYVARHSDVYLWANIEPDFIRLLQSQNAV